ncbi:MAG: hypothetical protein SFU86_09105 [Pirellulaceae bacterium]|nr:hypothetical protein [Pirellulaceae bacterium]
MARVKPPQVPPLVKLLCEDRRYKLEAYHFVQSGLEFAHEVLGMGGEPVEQAIGESASLGIDDREELAESAPPRAVRHVTGQQLCEAFRQLAQEQYGYLAKLVLGEWGIRSTSDFGEIVYNLIRIGMMSKSESDRREDFDGVYDFQTALMRDYRITRPESISL